MKKNIILKSLIILIIIAFSAVAAILKYNYENSRSTDVNYAATEYITKGFFKNNKLYKVDDIKLSFSDGNMAIVTVSGLLARAPHDNVRYNILLEKNTSGIWKVSKIYDMNNQAYH